MPPMGTQDRGQHASMWIEGERQEECVLWLFVYMLLAFLTAAFSGISAAHSRQNVTCYPPQSPPSLSLI